MKHNSKKNLIKYGNSTFDELCILHLRYIALYRKTKKWRLCKKYKKQAHRYFIVLVNQVKFF